MAAVVPEPWLMMTETFQKLTDTVLFSMPFKAGDPRSCCVPGCWACPHCDPRTTGTSMAFAQMSSISFIRIRRLQVRAGPLQRALDTALLQDRGWSPRRSGRQGLSSPWGRRLAALCLMGGGSESGLDSPSREGGGGHAPASL